MVAIISDDKGFKEACQPWGNHLFFSSLGELYGEMNKQEKFYEATKNFVIEQKSDIESSLAQYIKNNVEINVIGLSHDRNGVTEGYDYSVFDADYKLIDGGVYDNPDISIYAALKDMLEDFGLSEQDKRIPVDYDELMEKTEAVEREQLNERIRAEAPEADKVVADFKAKTEELFNGINGQTQDDIEQTVWAYLQSKLDEYEIDVELVDVVVSGSRCRGLEKKAPIWMWSWSIRAGSMKMICSMPLTRTV